MSAVLCALVVMIGSAQVSAETDGESVRVALVRTGDPLPFFERLAAELRSLGYEVIPVEVASSPQDLELEARSVGASATVDPDVPAKTVRVWFVDRNTGLARTRQLETSQAFDERIIALRAAELLRASLLVLPREPKLSVATPAVVKPPDVTSPVAEPLPSSASQDAPAVEHRWAMSVEAALARGLQSAKGSGHTVIGMGWGGQGLQLHGRVLLPLGASTERGAEGEATLRTFGAQLEGRWSWGNRWRPYVSAAIAVYRVQARGSAQFPYAGGFQQLFCGSPSLGGGMAWAATERLTFQLGIQAGMLLPAPELRFADRTVARLGSPAALGTAGVSWSL